MNWQVLVSGQSDRIRANKFLFLFVSGLVSFLADPKPARGLSYESCRSNFSGK